MSRSEGFAPIPTWMIRDAEVSIYALTVYAALSSRSGLREIIPGQATLAREARCSERQVRRAMAELESLGVVTRVRRKNSAGRAPDGYTLHPNGRIEVADTESATAEVPDSGDRGTGLGEQGFRTGSASTPSIRQRELGREIEATSDVAGDALPTSYPPDVFRLCGMLAEAVEANGHKVGVVGKTWWAACDRLMRLDGYTTDQIEWMIRWATGNEFWAANIRSMPTLREKFSTLVLQAKRDTQRAQRTSPDARARSVLDMGRELAREGMAS